MSDDLHDAVFYVLGGGTTFPLRNHFALCAPAYGAAAKRIHAILQEKGLNSVLCLTKMADSSSHVITNNDVDTQLQGLLKKPETSAIILSTALCDFDGRIGDVEPGWHADRLQSREGELTIKITPSEKVIDKIHLERPDVCIVGFKTTTNKTIEEQFVAAQRQINSAHVSFVFANDVVTRMNLVIPATAKTADDILYASQDREPSLRKLTDVVVENVRQRERAKKFEDLNHG
jgi:hypothetical protein